MNNDNCYALTNMLEYENKIATHFNDYPLCTGYIVDKAMKKLGITHDYIAYAYAKVIKNTIDSFKSLDDIQAYQSKVESIFTPINKHVVLPEMPPIKPKIIQHQHVHVSKIVNPLLSIDDNTNDIE